MEQVELDVALEELETRLERLRALYEQYFMGIERIEPAIARKDVDRRIYVLRREKIRNTAKRFKLQTIIQRYNTFQQYWQRICREIENGTYKRHILRAQKNGELLTIAARKRLGRAGRVSQPPDANQSQPPQPHEPPASAPPQSAEPPPSTPLEAPAPPMAASPAAAPAAAALGRPLTSPALQRRPPLPGARPAPDAALAAPAPAPPTPITAAKPAPAKFESLDLDMDFMGDWDPGTRRAGGAPKPAPAAQPKPAAPAPPPVAARPAAVLPAVPPGVPPAKPAPVMAPPPKPAAALAPPPPAATSRPGSIPPRPVAAPPRPASSSPPKVPLVPRAPTAPRVPPAAARPAVAPSPPKPAAAAASTSVDDARLRELHTRLQQAKQQTKEANVSYEGLAKSIRATEAKLREQHKNRKIDFDIVIKDGKAVVKPIVR